MQHMGILFSKDTVDFNFLPKINNNKKVLYLLANRSTPFFLVDNKFILDSYRQINNALNKYWGKSIIAYSFKTNYFIAKSKILFRQKNGWAEVASGQEYLMAKRIGYPGNRIIFNGPLKRNEELRQAAKDGALVHLDNMEELLRCVALSETFKKTLRIGIRTNVGIKNIGRSRFGFSIENHEAFDVVRQLVKTKKLKLVGLHLHLGTDIDEVSSFYEAADKLAKFAQVAQSIFKIKIQYLDLGGGFPAHGQKPFGKKRWAYKPIEKYIISITDALKKYYLNKKNPTLILEPGRYLVDDAVVFITQIINVKTFHNAQELTTDGAVTMLPLRYYRPPIVKIFNEDLIEKKEMRTNSIVYGASCREDDNLYQGQLPKADSGDYVIYYVTGAYNLNLSNNFIFNQPKTYIISRS